MAVAFSLFESQPTPLLGRSAEIEQIAQRLSAGETRLLTLTGPGGVGKTRLALAAAIQLTSAFPDGVSFVDLAGIRDPGLVLPTLAKQLGVLDAGGQHLVERLQRYLGVRAMVLILDNFEHVLPAASELAPLLAAAPRTALLVTSRVALHLRWEHTLRVPPLALPDLNLLPPLDELLQIPSVALFVARAR
ncbi:MAG TPA: AAA family ATPase, partial [Chloroflexota bacterium]